MGECLPRGREVRRTGNSGKIGSGWDSTAALYRGAGPTLNPARVHPALAGPSIACPAVAQ